MKKEPNRRRKARPTKRRYKTFTLVVEAQPMLVTYEPRWMQSDDAHFEFRSPHEPERRIPISETGYKSLFAAMEDVRQAGGPLAFAREHVVSMLALKRLRPDDPRQLALFR